MCAENPLYTAKWIGNLFYMLKYVLLTLIIFVLIFLMKPAIRQKMQPVIMDNKYTTTNVKENQKQNELMYEMIEKNQILTKVIDGEKNESIKKGNPIKGLARGLFEINAWNYYKKIFINNEGRVIDYQRDSVTTSEGQAYAMMRSLIMNDKKTFDKIYNWTKDNLQHKNDKLFAWLWGPKEIGKGGEINYQIIDQNGATDAGIEIAITLILASKIWEQESYLNDALAIMNDIWDKETIVIKGERILVAGVNQKMGKNVEVNPSYFMPYGFKIFAEIDEQHNWQALVNSSYRLTNLCIDNIKSGLPPDFFYMNKSTGQIILVEGKSDFSYDAIRVFYRFYIDYILTKEPRAEILLAKSKFFIDIWKHEGTFYTNYKQSGEPKDLNEAIGSIAILLPIIKLYDKRVAQDIYKKKILANYHFEGYWEDPLNYYAQNLVWFGLLLYLNEKNIQTFRY